MAENLFDLDVQVYKSQGSVEPQVLSIYNCSTGCGDGKTEGTCVATCGNECFSN
ncbi:FDLD family class I lanthipeptide [Paenibacillus sp. 1-18]|uniref:FDLD family class I lanthipeptide n=1 Tax=Paenibacillus sp. 1-18 TaxID=1333846 RepID=UPI0018CC05CA|nr:FDLD family class I lanthipeptide [Paenibacillus sp. 1-18]